MTFYEAGQVDVRKVLIDETLKGFARRMYKMKNIVNVQSTGAWINYFFQADPNVLTAGRDRNVKGIPRLAAFPQATTSFQKVRTDIEKYGLEGSIPYEDIIAGQVNVRDQTLMRIAEGVVYAVDTQIWTGLTTDTGIQTFNTRSYGGTATLGWAWNHGTAASINIVDDLEYAEQLIAAYNYPTSDLIVGVSPTDKRRVVDYFVVNGVNLPQIANDVLGSSNGVIGKIGNKTFIVSPVVSASQVLVCVPKLCATWKELLGLTTDVQNEPLKDCRIRAAEMGVLQVDNPKAIVVIKGTQI